jgi:hypothetical protein
MTLASTEVPGAVVPERLRRVDLQAGLSATGIEEVEVRDRPGWRARERAIREEAAALDPGNDPACARSTTRASASWKPLTWSAAS